MFNDLDSTLEAILTSTDPLAPVELRNADINFLTPDQTYSVGQATVNLFLFDVRENRQRRDPLPIREQNGDLLVRRRPPIRVDCSYLVTTWSNQDGALRIAEEHRLLGLALVWFSRFPEIPDVFLQGSLSGQPYPPPTMTAQMEGRQNTGEFWSALGIAPRPAFTVEVTVALELGVVEVEGPPVDTRRIVVGIRDESAVTPTIIPGTETVLFAVGGLVTDTSSGDPVPDATVEIDQISGRSAITDSDGRYRFDGLPAGTYDFNAQAPDGKTGTRNVSVSETDTVLNEYDIEVS